MTTWIAALLPGRSAAVRGRVRRRIGVAVLVIGAALAVLCVLALAGAARDDGRIDANTADGTAQVLSVGPVRTLVRFTAADGRVHTPQEGVAYPGGLAPGQLVRVEYDVTDPERVRVQGRRWTQGLGPVALAVGGIVLVTGSLGWWLVRSRGATRP